jgi:hypothetical protein
MAQERTFLQKIRNAAVGIGVGLSAVTGIVPGGDLNPFSANPVEACGAADFKLHGTPGEKTLNLNKGLTMEVGKSYIVDGNKFVVKNWPKEERSGLVEVTNGNGKSFNYTIERVPVKCSTQDAILTLVGDVEVSKDSANSPIEKVLKSKTIVKVSVNADRLIRQSGSRFDWETGHFIDSKKVKVDLTGNIGEENFYVEFKTTPNNKQLILCLQDVKGNKVYRMSPESTEDLAQLANDEYFRQCR